MKLEQASRPVNFLTIAALATIILLSACKKDLQIEQVIEPTNQNFERPAPKVNPFSLSNIQNAQSALISSHSDSVSSSYEIGEIEEERLYTYLKFDPNSVTGDILKELEADTLIHIMDFPFANGELYNDEFALDEDKAKELADGNLYAVVKKNSNTESTLKLQLNAEVLDELYLPEEEDTTLQFQAFREAGYKEEMLQRFRLCLFKRPTGFVRYLDQQTGNLVNVQGMQVWGLVFGIPIHTYTDGNGYYRLPWRFIAGTIMGTKAKNPRVNIKPLNTQGGWWLTITIQFIIGSTHVSGWVSSCQMRNDVDFNFTSHRQNRYWAQLMHSVSLHDIYCATDRINSAPQNLTMYAHWDDKYGDGTAPMLGHVSVNAALIEGVINNIFGGNINLPTNYPRIFNLFSGLLPDITIKTGNYEREFYSARLMQTAFHELGHGSHFQRAGHQYWINFISAILRPSGNCGGYGCGTGSKDGNIAVGESWAEFIGTKYALRNHPNGEKISVWNGTSLIRFDDALEREIWFFNNWIPTGVYNDLMDVINNDPDENSWDRTGGLKIKELYEAFGPKVDRICVYETEILRMYPWLGFNEVNEIFVRHGYACF